MCLSVNRVWGRGFLSMDRREEEKKNKKQNLVKEGSNIYFPQVVFHCHVVVVTLCLAPRGWWEGRRFISTSPANTGCYRAINWQQIEGETLRRWSEAQTTRQETVNQVGAKNKKTRETLPLRDATIFSFNPTVRKKMLICEQHLFEVGYLRWIIYGHTSA